MNAIKTALTQGIPFGLVMGVAFFFMGYQQAAIVGGVASASMFGGWMAYVSRRLEKKFAGQLQLEDAEHIVVEGPANHMLRAEGVGGWLYLTNRRLSFVSHKVNIQVHNLTIRVENIHGVDSGVSAGVIPNRLIVRTIDGDEHFVVSNRASWLGAFGS